MIVYRAVDPSFFPQYDQIPMVVHVDREFRLERRPDGTGWELREEAVPPYDKDLGSYERATAYASQFDISHWGFVMAFDGDRPVGGCTLVCRTPGVDMLEGRDDLCVLWDLRVADGYRRQGIGQALFDRGIAWAQARRLRWMKIESQHNNVPAGRFYQKQGAVLCEVNEHAYTGSPELERELQLIWYREL